MIVSSFFLPHCPAVIKSIGKEDYSSIPKTVEFYDSMVKTFQDKRVETVIIVSGQTIPSMDEFWVHSSDKLEGNFSLFESDEKVSVLNNFKLGNSIISEVLNQNIKIKGVTDAIDFGHLIPLYFLEKAMPNISALLFHISFESLLNHKKLGEIISAITQQSDERIGVIIAADLSNKVDKNVSKEYDRDASTWNKQFIDIVSKDLKKVSSLNPFMTEDVGGLYSIRAISVLEGMLSQYIYNPKNSFYEEAFGLGYGGVHYEVI